MTELLSSVEMVSTHATQSASSSLKLGPSDCTQTANSLVHQSWSKQLTNWVLFCFCSSDNTWAGLFDCTVGFGSSPPKQDVTSWVYTTPTLITLFSTCTPTTTTASLIVINANTSLKQPMKLRLNVLFGTLTSPPTIGLFSSLLRLFQRQLQRPPLESARSHTILLCPLAFDGLTAVGETPCEVSFTSGVVGTVVLPP